MFRTIYKASRIGSWIEDEKNPSPHVQRRLDRYGEFAAQELDKKNPDIGQLTRETERIQDALKNDKTWRDRLNLLYLRAFVVIAALFVAFQFTIWPAISAYSYFGFWGAVAGGIGGTIFGWAFIYGLFYLPAKD